MSRLKTALVIASLLIFSTAAVMAAPPGGAPPTQAGKGNEGGIDCLPGDAFENDEVRLWFQGLKGHLKVFDKRDNDTGLVYDLQTEAVAERTADNETLAHIDLGRAYPHDSTCQIDETEEWVNVTYEVAFGVKGTTGQAVGASNVTFVWHFNKTSQGAKFDLFVADWPWQADDSELAFDFSVTSAYTIETAENGIGFRDGSDSRGYIEWAPNATAKYADGHEENAVVESATDASDHHADVQLRFTNVSSGYTFLDYDPWVGVGDYIIVANVLIGLGTMEGLVPEAARPVYELIQRVL